jgi:hypothetical protein
MSGEEKGKRMLKIAKDKGKRSTGRPRKRWCDDI